MAKVSTAKIIFIFAILFFGVFGLAQGSQAATYYVDSSATSGSNNGTSWANAWTSLPTATNQFSALAAGDTVYISGGTTSQTYAISNWVPKPGNSSARVTYQTGQDAGHNGTVILDCSSGGNFLAASGGTLQYFTLSGDVNGTNHMQVQNTAGGWLISKAYITQVTLRGINFPGFSRGMEWSAASGRVTGFEIDRCVMHKLQYNTNSDSTSQIFYALGGNALGQNKIHDSSIYVPSASDDSAWGDDMFYGCGGLDFYNNFVKSDHTNAYTHTSSSQHADMFQTYSSDVRIYNNTFEDAGESIFYGDFEPAGSAHDWYIYDNLFVWTGQTHSGVDRGFDICPDADSAGSSLTNLVIANNTFVDWGGFNRVVGGECTYANALVQNNIYYNSSATTVPSGVTNSNNTSGSVQFTSYTLHAGSANNLHLKSSDTVAKDQGTSLLTYFTTDKDGIARTGTWDIGAYEYASGGGDTTAPAAPSGLTVN